MSEPRAEGSLWSPEHAARQVRAHVRLPAYGSKGYRWVQHVLAMTDPGDTVLDYGCGKGLFAKAMAGKGRTVIEYDPGIPGKDAHPEMADMVLCTDVLPFVERDRLAATIAHIEALAQQAYFVAIPYHPKEKLETRPGIAAKTHIVMEPEEWLAMFGRKPEAEMAALKPGGTPYLMLRWRA